MNFNKNLYKQQYYKYHNLRKKFLINNANIYFNRQCKQENLIPQYTRCKNKPYNKISKLSNQQYQSIRLNNEIKFLYKKKNYLSMKLYEQELYNMKTFDDTWHDLKQDMLGKLSIFISKKYQKLNNKIQQLKTKKIIRDNTQIKNCKPDYRSQIQFHDPIKNLTNITFNNNELSVIQNNFKSNFKSYKDNYILDNIVVETEHIIRNNENTTQDLIRHKISETTKNFLQQKSNNNSNNKITKQNNTNYTDILNLRKIKMDINKKLSAAKFQKKMTDFFKKNNQ